MRISSTALTTFLWMAQSTHDTNAFSIGSVVGPSQRSAVVAPLTPLATTLATITTITTSLLVASSMVEEEAPEIDIPAGGGDSGVYSLSNEQEHADFLSQHPDELVILKVYAPWCRACKALAPKFASLARDEALANTPIVFAQLSIQHNKDFIKSLGVLALPTVQFYVAGRLVDTFACGPSKFPTLKRKLVTLINDTVGIDGRLKPSAYHVADPLDDDDTSSVASTAEPSAWSEADRHMVANIPYFLKLSLADRDNAMEQARSMTFPAGAVILREGTPGDTFYVIQKGEVEICQQTNSDPLTGYLGTVINQLEMGNYFGERALITGEMNAASVRAATDVTVFAFHKDTFPASSVLSGRTRELAPLSLDDKYGVTNLERVMVKQFRDLSLANQVRGSVNTPRSLEDDDQLTTTTTTNIGAAGGSTTTTSDTPPAEELMQVVNKDDIFSLLTRMQRIRHVSNCVEYIRTTGATWPSSRRQLLVDRLSPFQRSEFTEIFEIMDVNHDGRIDLIELQRLMQSIMGEDEVSLASTILLNEKDMSYDDYMGLMAEAEFYTLFREIFQQLDRNRSGFVKARDLEKVLCGVRDLISDDRNSVIDVEDKDMLIDYEQFTRMLLGTTLVDNTKQQQVK